MDKLLHPLTAKENDVIRLVTQGKSRKEIADELGIAKGTIDTHFKRIFLKLRTRSMLETALWGVRNGFN